MAQTQNEVMANQAYRHWILTIPHRDFVPFLPTGICYIRGQLETGEAGFLHWQVYAVWTKTVRLSGIRKLLGPVHAEPTRSTAARDYVWKEDTRVEGTQFELGELPFRRNVATDWDKVRDLAKSGRLDDIPADVHVRYYFQLQRIRADYAVPVAQERSARIFWGPTGTGKSRRAWEEAGVEAYCKDPRTKWWCGYRGETHCIIDEFRGAIDVAHILRWLDRYPVRVETKGSSVPLQVSKFWFTSNLDPSMWFPELDEETRAAFRRRVEIIHCPINMF